MLLYMCNFFFWIFPLLFFKYNLNTYILKYENHIRDNIHTLLEQAKQNFYTATTNTSFGIHLTLSKVELIRTEKIFHHRQYSDKLYKL